jgi:hypothetical protein
MQTINATTIKYDELPKNLQNQIVRDCPEFRALINKGDTSFTLEFCEKSLKNGMFKFFSGFVGTDSVYCGSEKTKNLIFTKMKISSFKKSRWQN